MKNFIEIFQKINKEEENNIKNFFVKKGVLKKDSTKEEEENITENLNNLDDNDYLLDYFYCDITHMYSFIIKNDIHKYIKIIFRLLVFFLEYQCLFLLPQQNLLWPFL